VADPQGRKSNGKKRKRMKRRKKRRMKMGKMAVIHKKKGMEG
jgi:hypothetical protein